SGEKAAVMPTMVDFPTVVKDALAVFGEVFDTEAARRLFAESLTALIVAENQTVSGINRAFDLTMVCDRYQSSPCLCLTLQNFRSKGEGLWGRPGESWRGFLAPASNIACYSIIGSKNQDL